MRTVFILLLGCGISACATISQVAGTEGSKTVSSTGQLPTQTLGEGKCGIFAWTASAPRQFVFFAENQSQTAKYWNERQFDLNTATPVDFTAGPVLASYTDRDGKNLMLKLLLGQEIDGGVRVESGRIIRNTDSGWEDIQPIAGVYSCR